MLRALQLALAACAVAVIAERLYVLRFRAVLAPEAMRALISALERGDAGLVDRIVAARPESQAALLVAAATRDTADIDEARSVAHELAGRRLAALRVLATLASTLGLLAGIVALIDGFSGRGAGLLALKAGLAQRIGVSRALESMALGVAVSALCFHALGRLRPAARTLVEQVDRLARALQGPRA